MTQTSNQQRDAILAIAPTWLQADAPAVNGGQQGTAGRFLYNIGLAYDVLLQKLNEAQQAHMPTVCNATCLPYIGDDRLLTQGPLETTDSFRLRLQAAFQTWQLAGERIAVMRIVGSYMGTLLQSAGLAPPFLDPPVMAIVGGVHARQWSTYYVNDVENNFENPPALARLTSTNFSWDGLGGTRWWRNWLIFYNNLIPLGITGSSATVNSVSGGFSHITGLSGASGDHQLYDNSYLIVSGAASAGNNGTFQIVEVISDTEVLIANPTGVHPDANSGSISWSISKFPVFAPMPVWGAIGFTWGGGTAYAYGIQKVGGSNAFNVAAFLTTLRALISLWKSANTFYNNIIFTWDGGDGTAGYEFSPWSTETTGNPGGAWKDGFMISTTDAYGNSLNSSSVGYGPMYVVSYNTGQNSQLSAMVAVTDGTAIYQQCSTPTGC